MKDDANGRRLLLLTSVSIGDVAGVELDHEVNQDGGKDEQPVEDLADQVDVVLKSRYQLLDNTYITNTLTFECSIE